VSGAATVTESAQVARVGSIVAMIHVASVERSAEFYRNLGFEIGNYVPREAPLMQWAWLYQPRAANWKTSANLMLTRDSRPSPMDNDEPHVLFYLYAHDLVALRAELVAKDIKAGPICYPEYLPKGEFKLNDPDGYMLMVAQSGEHTPEGQ
jgi:hypothetical protein